MTEKLLPIGSIIIRKFDSELRKLMIVAYDVKNKSGKTFQYAACSYPEGMMNGDLFVFNQWRIGKILYENNF